MTATERKRGKEMATRRHKGRKKAGGDRFTRGECRDAGLLISFFAPFAPFCGHCFPSAGGLSGNTAQNTIATFSAAGDYTFQVTYERRIAMKHHAGTMCSLGPFTFFNALRVSTTSFAWSATICQS